MPGLLLTVCSKPSHIKCERSQGSSLEEFDILWGRVTEDAKESVLMVMLLAQSGSTYVRCTE